MDRGRPALDVKEIAPRFWRATARYGFMERPDIPVLLHVPVQSFFDGLSRRDKKRP